MKNSIKPSGIITLTTDFGIRDTFVGQIKGVILGINPMVSIIDITHQITPFCIKEAAYALISFYKYYPEGTIHIVIVDPGVGSQRKGLLMQCDGHFFIGPDNGLFTPLIQSAKVQKIIDLTERRFFNHSTSYTFHGRDIFAPVSAWLSKDEPLDNFGVSLQKPQTIDLPIPIINEREIIGSVLHFDNFGNIITNITSEIIKNRDFVVIIKGHEITKVNYYEEADSVTVSCLINSAGHLELFIYKGNCKDFLNLTEEDKIIVRYC